tara:strand:+ start:135 stop:1619 length:1485 start_codon:yes stop_codon:yes gene_type:complete
MKGFGHNISKKSSKYSTIKQKLINEALAYQNQGDLNLAAKCYENIIQRGYEDNNLLSNYGIVLFQLGYTENAITLFKEYINRYPYEPAFCINLSNIYKIKNDLVNSEIFIRKSLQLNPNCIISLNNLSSILILKKEFNEAERFSLNSLNLDNQYNLAHFNLGLIYCYLDRINDSIDSFRKAIKFDPEDFETNLNLGATLLKKGDYEESKKYNEIALRLNNSSHEAFFNLGQIALYTGDLDLAINKFKQSLSKRNDNYKIYRFLGITEFLKGDEECLKNLKKSIIINHEENLSKVIFHIVKKRLNDKDLDSCVEKSIPKSKFSEPIILQRNIEKELVDFIYRKNTIDLNNYQDPTFGKARGTDYDLFKDDIEILNLLKVDLIKRTKNIFESEVCFIESFFTILEGKSIVQKHNHLDRFDKIKKLDLYKNKFSLVYYIKTCNSNCTEPGFLKFYNPDTKLLPKPGMIVIFPAERFHSVEYNGTNDRIILGVNFYIY